MLWGLAVKKMLFAGIVFPLVFGTMFTMSCDPEAEEVEEAANPLVGTWEAASGYKNVFTATNVTVYDTSKNIYWNANYTYNDTHVTVTLDTVLPNPELIESWGEARALTYHFTDEALYLNGVRLVKCP
jgi:hypothetical protein